MRVMFIVLDGTDSDGTDAGDNVVLNGTDSDSSNAGEDLLAGQDSLLSQ